MKRIKIAVIIMAAVVVAALGIYFIADYFNDKSIKESKEEDQKLIMFEFNGDDINKVEINNDGGRYIAEYVSGTGWQLTNNNEFVLNEAAISTICTNICNLKATKILEGKDISKYGFDDPVKVTAFTKDGSSYTVIVGNPTPTYENFYAMKENDDNIYLINFTSGSVLSPSKDAMKYTYSYPYSTYDVTHFALWKGKESDDNILFSMSQDGDGTWYMEKPYENNRSVYNTQIDTFLTRTSKDEITSFVQENCPESDYSKYGFDDPQYVFEISTKDDNTKIIFGNLTEDGSEMYALYPETGQVVTFLSNGVTTISYTTLDMLNTPIFSTDITKVSEVEITAPDINATIKISSEEYTLNEKKISDNAEKAFLTFFDSFNNAYYKAEENESKPSENDKAELTVKYTLKSNIVTEITYIPIPDSNNYWVNKNDEYTGYSVNKDIISNIISSYEKLQEAIS